MKTNVGGGRGGGWGLLSAVMFQPAALVLYSANQITRSSMRIHQGGSCFIDGVGVIRKSLPFSGGVPDTLSELECRDQASRRWALQSRLASLERDFVSPAWKWAEPRSRWSSPSSNLPHTPSASSGCNYGTHSPRSVRRLR